MAYIIKTARTRNRLSRIFQRGGAAQGELNFGGKT